jgi:alpha-N-arabinofuranosidase
MVLTDADRMLLTPTYHVFEMYKVHQDATLLPCDLQSDRYAEPLPGLKHLAAGEYGASLEAIDQLSASASVDQAGAVHVSLCNLHHEKPAEMSIDCRGMAVSKVSGRILTAPAMNSMNTFDRADAVGPREFDEVRINKTSMDVYLPARSVAVLEVR